MSEGLTCGVAGGPTWSDWGADWGADWGPRGKGPAGGVFSVLDQEWSAWGAPGAGEDCEAHCSKAQVCQFDSKWWEPSKLIIIDQFLLDFEASGGHWAVFVVPGDTILQLF